MASAQGLAGLRGHGRRGKPREGAAAGPGAAGHRGASHQHHRAEVSLGLAPAQTHCAAIIWQLAHAGKWPGEAGGTLLRGHGPAWALAKAASQRRKPSSAAELVEAVHL